MQNATYKIHYKCKLLKVLIILLKCVIQAVHGRERNFISHETSSYSTMMLLQIGRWWWILYSFLVPCYGSLKPGFSQLQRGHRLGGKVIQSFTELSFLDCVIECLVTPRCKSVNYFKGANFCESNYENQTTAETKYVEIAGWVYSDKEHWPKVNVLESLRILSLTLKSNRIFLIICIATRLHLYTIQLLHIFESLGCSDVSGTLY